MKRLARPAAAVLLVLLGGFFCGDAGALSPEQCSYFEEGGKTAICHATQSARQPFVLLHVSPQACAASHAGHPNDFLAINDPSCNGTGSLPEGAPCDATLECGSGLACVADVCAAVAPLAIH